MSYARGVIIGAVFVLVVVVIAGFVSLDFYLQQSSSEPEILRPKPTSNVTMSARPVFGPRPTPTLIIIPIVLPPTTITPPPTPTQVETDEDDDDNEPEPYRVVAGDTLLGIARRFDVAVEELIVLNDIQDASLISVGQELLIPPR